MGLVNDPCAVLLGQVFADGMALVAVNAPLSLF